MTTTCVRDSIVGDQWIYATAQSVPVQKVFDDKGNFTGDYLTGPVRIAFDSLFELPKPSEEVPNPKYGASLLFTPYADFAPLYEAYYEICGKTFPEYYDAATGQYNGLYSPFRDQREKAKFGGFTPGCNFITSTSKFKPPVVDIRRNPIVDPSKVYPGVWAICAVNPYSFNDKRKKGVAFGLQSVMIIGDDTKFGGGAPDPNKTFGGMGSVAAPIVRPDAMKGVPTATGQAPAPVNAIPGYTPAPAPAAAPAPAYQAPAAPAYTPPAPAGDDDMSFMN